MLAGATHLLCSVGDVLTLFYCFGIVCVRVDSDDSLYAEYLAWHEMKPEELQTSYSSIGRSVSIGHCRLCELLHLVANP